jgi:hypothetical protein
VKGLKPANNFKKISEHDMVSTKLMFSREVQFTFFAARILADGFWKTLQGTGFGCVAKAVKFK